MNRPDFEDYRWKYRTQWPYDVARYVTNIEKYCDELEKALNEATDQIKELTDKIRWYNLDNDSSDYE